MLINNNNYTHEIEIKISRSDFKADFKKDKHKFINGISNNKFTYVSILGLRNRYCSIQNKRHHQIRGLEYPSTSIYIYKINNNWLPNKFSFCVPEGLVEIKDLPDYAGLLYIDSKNQIRQIKKAKFIHKDKFDKWEGLATKYYYRFLRLRKN